jgi:hypothetical protein
MERPLLCVRRLDPVGTTIGIAADIAEVMGGRQGQPHSRDLQRLPPDGGRAEVKRTTPELATAIAEHQVEQAAALAGSWRYAGRCPAHLDRRSPKAEGGRGRATVPPSLIVGRPVVHNITIASLPRPENPHPAVISRLFRADRARITASPASRDFAGSAPAPSSQAGCLASAASSTGSAGGVSREGSKDWICSSHRPATSRFAAHLFFWMSWRRW